jgi:6-phosphogluconate dehydrogenase
MGPDGAGHYVKMVHNGIEYGDMQLICEAYAILRDLLGLTPKELHDVFAGWNRGDLDSFLIEITANIFLKEDPETGQALVDVILDRAAQKGTGKWTLQSAIEQTIVVSTINAAVEARILSSLKEQRVRASQQLPGPSNGIYEGHRHELIDAVRDALYASKIISYAQGFTLFAAASQQFRWNLHYGDIATIWRGGCIIRAKFLNRIKEAFDREPKLENLMLDPFFKEILVRTQKNWRFAISQAIQAGVAVPAFSASLAYYDSYREERLPANLLQAQRDYFGAHTYERVDKPGSFHTEWLQQ